VFVSEICADVLSISRNLNYTFWLGITWDSDGLSSILVFEGTPEFLKCDLH